MRRYFPLKINVNIDRMVPLPTLLELKFGAAALFGALVTYAIMRTFSPSPEGTSVFPEAVQTSSVNQEGATTEESLVPQPHQGAYDTGEIAGRKIGDLYQVYLGLSKSTSLMPVQLTIDCDQVLTNLWERKKRRSNGNPVVTEAAEKIVLEYKSALNIGQMDIATYQAEIARASRGVYESLDWAAVATMYGLNARKTNALKRAADNIGGRSLLAYSMTELLPSHTDGRFNRAYMDLLLRSCGKEFVERLPAVHDPYTSFGTYQFTQFAVYGGPTWQKSQGASRVNYAMPNGKQIPGSVIRLRGPDHAQAAYMFGVHNLALLMKKLNARQLATFERIAGSRGLDIAEFIAAAHNKPAVAIRGGRLWLDNRARTPYKVSLPRVSRIYATKTYHNYHALAPTAG